MSIIRKSQLVLFGAGGAGGYALKHLRSQGIEPVCFADNNDDLWSDLVKPPIKSPHQALLAFPEATWVVTAIRRPAAVELRAQAKAMGVKTKPLWECLPVKHGLPPLGVGLWLHRLVNDSLSERMINDQFKFRRDPDYDRQEKPSNIEDIYFEDFFTHLDDEHFVDCGAADGDTVREFLKRWEKWAWITAFEPDPQNYEKLLKSGAKGQGDISCVCAANGDYEGEVCFVPTGDYSAHIGKTVTKPWPTTNLYTLDEWFRPTPVALKPTFIKMDIEGSELEALWGARHILAEHKPILAICAYHESDHFWKIPLLLHALQPEYRFYFRRYGEGAFELVWYAVPPERIADGSVEESRKVMQQIAVSDHDCPEQEKANG